MHARQRFEAGEQLAIELNAARLGVAGSKQIVRRHQDVVGIEAGVDLLRVDETPDEKPGAHEQQQRERHLRDGERAGQARLAGSARHAVAGLLQHAAGRLRGGAESRKDPEDDAGDEGEHERRCQNGTVGLDGEIEGKIHLGHETRH